MIPQYADLPENWAPAIPNFIIFPSEFKYWDTPHFWTKPNKCHVDATIHQLYTYPTNLTKYPHKLICSDCILAKSTNHIIRQKTKCDHTFFRKLNKNHQSISPIPVVWIEISTPTCQLGLLQAASISPDPSLTRSNPLVLERS